MPTTTRSPAVKVTPSRISAELDRRKLLALAFKNEAQMYTRAITPKEYGKNCTALAAKLGFGITQANLKAAKDEILAADNQ